MSRKGAGPGRAPSGRDTPRGSAKTAQKHKLLTDAFKLIYAAQFPPKEARKVLVVADPKAVRHLDGKGWMAQALRANRVEIEVVDLPTETMRLCGGRKSASSDSFSTGTVQQVLWYRMSAYMR